MEFDGGAVGFQGKGSRLFCRLRGRIRIGKRSLGGGDRGYICGTCNNQDCFEYLFMIAGLWGLTELVDTCLHFLASDTRELAQLITIFTRMPFD